MIGTGIFLCFIGLLILEYAKDDDDNEPQQCGSFVQEGNCVNKKEAILAMLDGKKVKRIKWMPANYLYMDHGYIKHRTGDFYDINLCSYSDWEEYVEPHPKPKFKVNQLVLYKGRILVVHSIHLEKEGYYYTLVTSPGESTASSILFHSFEEDLQEVKGAIL